MEAGWFKEQVQQVAQDHVDIARTLPAATLYEANGQRGALDPAIRQMAPGLKLCGSAFTVRCQPGDNLTLHAAVAFAKPGDVIVADTGDFSDAGHWGEILTVAAKSRNLAGLVINGGVRDIATLGVWEFPVFARAVSMKATTKRIRGLLNHPLVCGEVEIAPGDLLVGDEDGVVAIRHSEITDVLQRAHERETKEARIMGRVRDGELTIDLLNMRSLVDPDAVE